MPASGVMAESATQARLTLLGRAQLEQAGFTDADARKVRQRLVEGMDAVKVKVFLRPGLAVVPSKMPDADAEGVALEAGEIIADVPRIDYGERRQAAVELAKLLDWYPNKLEHEVHGQVSFNLLGLDGDRV